MGLQCIILGLADSWLWRFGALKSGDQGQKYYGFGFEERHLNFRKKVSTLACYVESTHLPIS